MAHHNQDALIDSAMEFIFGILTADSSHKVVDKLETLRSKVYASIDSLTTYMDSGKPVGAPLHNRNYIRVIEPKDENDSSKIQQAQISNYLDEVSRFQQTKSNAYPSDAHKDNNYWQNRTLYMRQSYTPYIDQSRIDNLNNNSENLYKSELEIQEKQHILLGLMDIVHLMDSQILSNSRSNLSQNTMHPYKPVTRKEILNQIQEKLKECIELVTIGSALTKADMYLGIVSPDADNSDLEQIHNLNTCKQAIEAIRCGRYNDSETKNIWGKIDQFLKEDACRKFVEFNIQEIDKFESRPNLDAISKINQAINELNHLAEAIHSTGLDGLMNNDQLDNICKYINKMQGHYAEVQPEKHSLQEMQEYKLQSLKQWADNLFKNRKYKPQDHAKFK